LLLQDGLLLLHDFACSLSEFAGTMSVKLQPSIVAIANHCTESKEGGSGVGARRNGRHTNRCNQEQERPDGTEDELNLNPRDAEKAFNDMENVEYKHDARKPEARHCDRVEKRSASKVRVL